MNLDAQEPTWDEHRAMEDEGSAKAMPALSQLKDAKEAWPRWQRIAIRFAAVYMPLTWFPFPLGYMPGTDAWGELVETPLRHLAVWVGSHVLHLSYDVTVFTNGSGDTTYNYVNLLDVFALSAMATLAWSVLDPRKLDYAKLHDWLRIFMRYTLGATMLLYGFVKVIKTQFPAPRPDLLLQPIGESSPMRLLWVMMGYSTTYTFFAGAMELLAGALLFFRRTTCLGALAATGVMANVVALNFSYDVPVKIFSSHLLLMAVLLLLPDLRRLADFFVFQRATEPVLFDSPRFERRWMNHAKTALKVLAVGGFAIATLVQQVDRYHRDGDGAPKADLEGIYEIDAFTRNGETIAPLLTEGTRWRWLARRQKALVIRPIAGLARRYEVAQDDGAKELTVFDAAKPDSKYVITYTRAADGSVTFHATLEGDVIVATARKVDESQFRLVSRGFHWINEKPFNK